MRILVTGQCSLHLGRLENGNIGNYYITETLFRELHRVFPSAEIRTTFQMSETFCRQENVFVLPMELFYGWTSEDLTTALKEYGIAELYERTQKLFDSTPFLEEVIHCDLFVDFSGEMWGYHADLVGKDRFLIGLLKDRVAQLMGKPTVLLAGSQGRFPDPKIKLFAKEVFENFTLVANRECETGKLLELDGFSTNNLRNYACPAFLFEPSTDEREIQAILEKEGVLHAQIPTVGCVICGFNMREGPYNKWPRDDAEYLPFVEAIEHLMTQYKVRIVLLSHSNGFERVPEFKLVPGRDYPIIKQLFEILIKRGKVDSKRLVCVRNPYPPKFMKAIIGKFDMFVSGRLHASVAATSQQVPTVVIMHGHQQISHKTVGFFDILGMPECVADPTSESLLARIDYCWNHRDVLRKHLQQRMPEVKQLAQRTFDDLKELATHANQQHT